MYYVPRKGIQGFFPPVYFRLASSWSMMPAEVVSTMKPMHIKPGADHSTLIQPAGEVHNNFASPVMINDFKFANVIMLHFHN